MSKKTPLFRKLQRLTQALMISGTLNIALLALLVYWQFREVAPTPYFENKPAARHQQQRPLALEASSSAVIRNLKKMTLDELLTHISDKEIVESGYSVGALAVGCLMTFHHFDIEKALMGLPKPKEWRQLTFEDERGNNEYLNVLADLADSHLAAFKQFGTTEQWPITSEAMFNKLKSGNTSASLIDAFTLTREYQATQLLFSGRLKKEEILALLTEGTFAAIVDFAEQQRVCQDLSDSRRRNFLVAYLKQGSQTAATLLLTHETAFAIKKLDDDHVITLLKHCSNQTAQAARYALTMLISPRSDRVWREAADRLFEFVGEEKPRNYDRSAILSRFVPQLSAAKIGAQRKPEASAPTSRRAYTVQDRDSLWKISRRFHVEIEEIKKINRLETETLQPGTVLLLP